VLQIQDIKISKLINPVVTTGTFDGLHLGHQKVIYETINIAKEKGATPVILTFWPHPRYVLQKGNFSLINTFDEKSKLFKQLGLKNVYYQEFTKEFSQLSSEEYVKKILVDKIGLKTLVIGYDHQFGKEREGGFETLEKLSKKYNFELIKVSAFDFDTTTVSSTKIRNSIENGELDIANSYLGYNYFIAGKVISGFNMGKKIGFPTANIEPGDKLKLLPKDGVYAVFIEINNKMYGGMLNIGYRPTFVEQPKTKTIEVNIFDFSENIYEKLITVYFVKRIRDELKLNSVNELITLMKNDETDSRKILQKGPLILKQLV